MRTKIDQLLSESPCSEYKGLIGAAVQEANEQKIAGLKKNLVDAVAHLEAMKKAAIDAIRQHRKQIEVLKSRLDEYDRILAYAQDPEGSVVPLLNINDKVPYAEIPYGDPARKVPEGWQPKE